MFDREAYMKKYRNEHREKAKNYSHQWYIANEKKSKATKYLWYQKNKEKATEYSRQYYKDNKERCKLYHHQYYLDNRQERMEKRNIYCKNKRRIDLKYKLNSNLSSMIRQSLKGKKMGRSWEGLVGYILIDLINRLKKTMPEGYTWQDFLESKLHIDHIVPISAFHFDKPEHTDFKRCWDLKNLQLLPAKENLSKHNKLNKPFQPALKI